MRRVCPGRSGAHPCAHSLALHIPVLLPGHTRRIASSGASAAWLRSAKAPDPLRSSGLRGYVATRSYVAAAADDRADGTRCHPARSIDPDVRRGRRTPGIRGKRHRDVPRPRVRTGMCARAVTRIPGVRRPPAEASASAFALPDTVPAAAAAAVSPGAAAPPCARRFPLPPAGWTDRPGPCRPGPAPCRGPPPRAGRAGPGSGSPRARSRCT